MLSVRPAIAHLILTLFVLYVLVSGIRYVSFDALVPLSVAPATLSSNGNFPDFSRYYDLQTLSPDEFPIDDPKRRVIIIGDIHGRFTELRTLLRKAAFNPNHDVLVSTGDIVAKGPINGSLAVLSYLSENNVTAVRGNHDEKVIEWRSWIEWIHTLPGGKRWLRNIYQRFLESKADGDEDFTAKEWMKAQMKRDRKRNSNNTKWWDRIPEGWVLFGPHYLIAEQMSESQYHYMLRRPLRIHIPHAHTYIAHAGVLASNPKLQPHDKRQPLAHVPYLSSPSSYTTDREAALRRLQELAVLHDVPQNRDPWVTLNMRSVKKNREVTRKSVDTPWSELYDRDVSLCAGFDVQESSSEALPCHPSTVIYGHAASRGLDIKRWTIGLDSGCVYNRRLSALILGGASAGKSYSDFLVQPLEGDSLEYEAYDIDNNRIRSTIRFGEKGIGKIFSIKCHKS